MVNILKNLILSSNRWLIVALVASLTIVSSELILIISYNLMDIEIRQSELLLGFFAPLTIATPITWFLISLIKQLDTLEKQLRDSISKEKQAIYVATIHGAQHVTNNLLNSLMLVDMEIENHPDFDQETIQHFRQMVENSRQLIEDLSSVELIEADSIRDSVAP